MAGISLAHGNLDSYVSNANEVVRFKLVRNQKDIEDTDVEFPPEYTHQFFGDSENIFGYIGLRVDLYYTASRLLPFFRITYDEAVNISKSGGVEPDNVLKIISDKLEMPLPTSLNDFSVSLMKEFAFKPIGKQICSFELLLDDNASEAYEIYRADILDNGFRQYHERMQTFILWFIDAASYIDVDDDRWEYFVVYERVKENEDTRFYFAGFTTVYRYYAYPVNLRPRISQMLILPPFQKRGLGAELLHSINNWYIQNSDVLEITVEDPSENFVRLRDFVDCKNCANLPSFQRGNLLRGFSKEMVKEAQTKFKICKKQARRVYEILRLHVTNTANAKEYRDYRLEVKKRLNAPYQRQKLDVEKLKKTLSPDEYTATVNCTTTEQRIEQLDRLYKDVEAEYMQVLERLSASV